MVVVFVAGAVLAGIFWILMLGELVAMVRFTPWSYRLGPRYPGVRARAPQNLEGLSVGDSFETRNAKFEVVAQGVCLGRHKFLLSLFNHPFPVKGTFRAEPGRTAVEWRLPISSLGFIASFLLAWSSGAVAVHDFDSIWSPGTRSLAIGWGAAVALLLFGIAVERRRAIIISSELEDHCQRSGREPMDL